MTTLFTHTSTKSQAVSEGYLTNFERTVIYGGYFVYDKLPNVTFTNYQAHVRHYQLIINNQNKRYVFYQSLLFESIQATCAIQKANLPEKNQQKLAIHRT